MLKNKLVGGLLIAVLHATVAAAQVWTPPIGIPAPTFGITQTLPGSFTTVTSLPHTMNPGDAIKLTGTFTGGDFNCAGTLANPCYVTMDPTASMSGDYTVSGTYTIVDGIKLTGAHSLGVGGAHNVVRNCESTGQLDDPTGASIFVTGFADVIWKNYVHDHGDIHGTSDTDAHGISVVRSALETWILENETARNAGDGINVNSFPYDTDGISAIQVVYIGRNLSHGNKQTSIWTKQSAHVIVSQNEMYGEVADPVGFSYGQCVGYQYGTQDAWYIYNNIHDCGVGVGISGDLGIEPATPPRLTFVVHNLFDTINGPPTSCGNGDEFTCATVYITGGAYYYVIDNTDSTVVDGIHATRDAGLYQAGNTGSNWTVTTDAPLLTVNGGTASIYSYFTSLYGLDISGGTVPDRGVVGPSFSPGTIPNPTPPPAPFGALDSSSSMRYHTMRLKHGHGGRF